MSVDDKAQRQNEAFRKALNAHGFGFQYAVMERIREVVNKFGLPWVVAGAEIPVQVKGKDTHVDFVLRQPYSNGVIIAECKRADPALARWCFAKSTDYGSPDGQNGGPQIERLVRNTTHSADPVELRVMKTGGAGLYQVGVEVKTDRPGDGIGGNREAIVNAVTQVLRGTNGIVNLIRENERFIKDSGAADLYPVVFTTAKLFTTEQELHSADVLTGDLPPLSDFQQRDWIWYQHNVSHSLLSDVRGRFVAERQPNLARMLVEAHVRSVAIVSASGIESFMRHVSE